MQPDTTRPYLEHLDETRTGFEFETGWTEHDIAGEGTSSSRLRTRSADGKPPVMSKPWTPAEKNAFFRALSAYSRWRPDLIAAAVPTRSVWEVDLYLAALEEGAESLDRAENGDGYLSDFDLDEEDSGSDLELEPAHEVSDAWVAVEETLASCIIQGDNSALLERYRKSLRAEKGKEKEKRPRGRPRKGDGTNARRPYRRLGARKFASYADAKPQECVDSQHAAGTQVDRSSVANQAETMSPNQPPAKRLRLGKREDHLACLGDAHLSALDSILRDHEESLRIERSYKENQDAASPLLETREGTPPSHEHEREMQTIMNVTDTIVDDPSNAMIDPVLLAISGGNAISHRFPSNTTMTMSSIPIKAIPATDRSLLVSSSSPPTKAAVTDDAQQDATDFVQNHVRAASEGPATLNADLLSPKSRRRLQKRLYMRRRRARLQGKEEASYSTTEVETTDIGQVVGLGRLKPGRKAKDKSRCTSSAPTSNVESDDEEPTKVKQTTHGLTLRSKLKSMFSKLGVDAAYLRAQGMDLLHLNTLARLMGFFTASECGSPPDDASTDEIKEELPFAIDATLIRHLQAAVVFFVTDVIYRAIAWKEGQIRLKQGSLAWRSSDQRLTVSAIKHAIETLGMRYKSHKEFFAELCSRNDTESSDAENESAAIRHFNRSTDHPAGFRDEGGCEKGDPAVPAVSTHRDLYMPFIRPPSALGVHPLDCFSRTYMREATRRADREREVEADWMSSETDEEALEAELREDEALDEEDMENAAEYEEMLWEALGDTSDSFP
ncbi:hypothetical protein EDD16DRAFT_1519845 [Pisolithus croceorrhizus]|nr:hypothetical protein EV401DRAFT_1977131 [Pisolithus croceorrhizus]KAI6117829.1 hypothetical protein EDD16DRAFT_1519845 [Pisolithus croceorrhizus]KAI6163334.1 hypothetical protein EDD17DRAFT_1507334 [Pisolithus thermaeus]